MRRIVTPERLNDCIGGWRIMCAECPLLPHLVALGMPAKPCANGISTKIQGAITMSTCEHYEKESIESDTAKVVTLNCRKEAA